MDFSTIVVLMRHQNGGKCYMQPLPGLPTGIPLCGCTYRWSGPTCATPSTPLRLCNPANSTDPLENPPFCQVCCVLESRARALTRGYQYCNPDSPVATNGCLQQGRCTLATSIPGSTLQLPPNFELPLCVCWGGIYPPQCRQTIFEVYNRTDAIAYRYESGALALDCGSPLSSWIWFSLFLVVGILAVALIVQHVVVGLKSEFQLGTQLGGRGKPYR